MSSDAKPEFQSLSGNILAGLPARPGRHEAFETLLGSSNMRIERIVSTGQASPEGFWYDQPQAEWVLVVQGSARLRFEDEPEPRLLRVGDYVYIAQHRRHRVEHTQADPPTVWLAVHIEQATE